jgi:SNF2 family DNA or RNA helicase
MESRENCGATAQGGRWVILDGDFWMVDPEGKRTMATVSEIFGALVLRSPPYPWVPTTISGLVASRYPIVPSVLICQDASGAPTCFLSGAARGKRVNLELIDLRRGHAVRDGHWYPVDSSETERLLELIESNSPLIGRVGSLKALLQLKMLARSGGPVEDQLPASAIAPEFFGASAAESPIGVNARLFPYQVAGWRWLKFVLAEGVGGLLADEMGLGKTLQVISVLSDSGGAELSPALIIAPGSLLENWSRELARFAPHLRVIKHHGPQRSGRPSELAANDVVLTTYDGAVTDGGLLNSIVWKVVVLDEAQYIKNPSAQRTRAVKRLKREAGLAVTGTPVQNRLVDLWSLVDFAMPGFLGSEREFVEAYPDDEEGASRLEPVISPLMLRRRVAEVAQDLPPRIVIPQFVELSLEEAESYERLRHEIIASHGNSAALVALTSLRQFCAHPFLVQGVSDEGDVARFSKFERLHEIAEEIFESNEKVLVFTSYTRMADLIAQHVSRFFGVYCGVIDGRLPIPERQPMIDSFSQVRGGAALILNPIAGGSGLNISAANHVIHYNPEWNPAMEDQATARAHRRGQALPVTVHRLLVASSVEEVINDRLERKRQISEAAVVGVAGRDEDYADILKALSATPLKI